MTNKITSMLSRLAAQFLKHTLAILATLAVGGVWAAYDQIWTPTTQTDGKYYWDESSNWVNGTAEYGNYVINSPSSADIYFRSSYSSTSATWLFMENGGSVTFSGDDASCGLSLSGNLTIGTGLAAAQLSINKGYYSVGGSIVLASGSNNGSLTISGGTVETVAVIGGTDSGIATLELGGGILRAVGGGTFIGSGVAASVTGASTIDTNGKAISIETAITGSGTLTITGGGVATFTTAPTCGLKVENGVAVLPGNSKTGAIEIGAHGVLAFDLTGWTIANGTAYTLAWNVASLTVPNGESYADSIFTIGPDFTSTISYENNTIYATATGDATYTGSTANLRQIAIPNASAWVDNTAEWINGVTPNGASNSGTPGNTGYAYRRDIVVVPHDARILFWQANHPDNITLVNRGATLTLTSWDSTESTLVIENLVNTGTIVNGEGGASGTTYAFNLIVNNTVTTGGTVTLSNGSALTFPAGSTFADISATTVKVTGTVTGTTVAANGTIGAGSTLFTLTGAAPAFANSTVTVSINNADTPIHYTKGDNGVYTAGRVLYWIGGTHKHTEDYWSDTSKAGTAIGAYPIVSDTAVLDGGTIQISEDGVFPANIVVRSDSAIENTSSTSYKNIGIGLRGASGVALSVIHIQDNARLTLQFSRATVITEIAVYSAIYGEGSLSGVVNDKRGASSGIRLYDTLHFNGTVNLTQATANQYNSIVNANAVDNKNSKWYISTNGVCATRIDLTGNNKNRDWRTSYTPFALTDTDYHFGVLCAHIGISGTLTGFANNKIRLCLGEKIDEDSWLRGAWYNVEYLDKVKWLAKTATFTQAVANAYEVDVMGGGKVYIEKDTTENGNVANFVPSLIKFLAYTDSENVVRGGGYLTLDSNNSAIAGDIVNAVAAAGDGETQVATGFDVDAVNGGVSAAVTQAAVLENAVGFNKKGAGTLTLSGAFTKLGAVNVSEGLLVIEATSALTEGDDFTCAAGTLCTAVGTTYTFGRGVAIANDKTYQTVQAAVDAVEVAGEGTVTLIADVTEDVVVEAAGVSIVLGDYTITGTVTSSEDYDLVYDEDTKTWTSSETANFIWCGGNGTSWSTPANWKKNALPGATDTVVFPENGAPWTVVMNENCSVASICVEGETILSGAAVQLESLELNDNMTLSEGTLSFVNTDSVGATISGSSNLSMGIDAELTTAVSVEVTIPTITISGTAEHPASATAAGGVGFAFKNAFVGTGTLVLDCVNDNVIASHRLSGNNAAFGGAIKIPYRNGNNQIQISAGQSGSALAKWEVYNSSAVNFCEPGNTSGQEFAAYHFGELTGEYRHQLASNQRGYCRVVIGELGTSFALDGVFGTGSKSDRATVVQKEGEGTLSFGGTNARSLILNDGTTLLTKDACVTTMYGSISLNGGALKLGSAVTSDVSGLLSFNDNKSAILDDGDISRAFASAIGNDKSANFTKKGSGALTLDAVPTYTGTTKVEDGVLYVINGDYTLTLDSSTAEVTTDKDGYRKFVPASVTVAAPTVVWGDDFVKVTVSAEVNSNYGEGGLTYNLKIGGNVVDGVVGTVNNGVVTFSDVNVSGLNLSRYGDVSVEVTASAGGSQAATSGPKNVMFADTIDWVNENHETTTTAAAGGAWQTPVTYDSETHKAAVVDNRFSATNCTTGDVVTVTIDDVVYTGLSDLTSVDTDAQGAVAVGGTETAPKFMLLTKKNDTVGWYEAAGVTPVLETGVYDIVMTFDYNSKTYTVTVNGTPLTVDSVAAVPLAKAQTSVKDIDFLGAGSLAAINGVQYEGKMAIDQNGVKYATVEAALQANANVKGAVIKLLHGSATTSAEGWNFDSETKTFVKKVIGLIFLAF